MSAIPQRWLAAAGWDRVQRPHSDSRVPLPGRERATQRKRKTPRTRRWEAGWSLTFSSPPALTECSPWPCTRRKYMDSSASQWTTYTPSPSWPATSAAWRSRTTSRRLSAPTQCRFQPKTALRSSPSCRSLPRSPRHCGASTMASQSALSSTGSHEVSTPGGIGISRRCCRRTGRRRGQQPVRRRR